MLSNNKLTVRNSLQIAALLLVLVVPLQGYAATVHYNDAVEYKGPNDVSTSLSIDFAYNSDTSTISEVSGIFDNGTLKYKIYNDNFPQGDPTPNLLNILFVNTDINFSRRNYFNTFFFADNTAPDPLSLAFKSETYGESSAVVFCTIVKCTPYAPTQEKLTNLDWATAVPVPPALLLFAGSLLGIGALTKQKSISPVPVNS